MSATGVIWLSAFSLVVGVCLAAAPRFWARRLVIAWYFWLGGVGLSALILGQIVVALVRNGRYRLDDPGPLWLGAEGFDMSLSVSTVSAYGAGAVFLIVLATGALVTQVGVRLEPADRSSLARLAWVAGGACLVMSARSYVLALAGWTICSRAMAGGRVDPRSKAWSVLGDLGVLLFALALFAGAGLRDMQAIAGIDLSTVQAPLIDAGGLEISTAEVAVMGLALAIVSRALAPTGAWVPGGGAGAYAIARLFAGAVVPWIVLSLRAGKLLAHAPWGMVAITVVGLWLVLGGALRVAHLQISGSVRVVGYARVCAGVPVIAVGLGHADLAMYAAVIGAGNAVTFALAGGRVPMRGLGRWAVFAWLGVAPFSGFLVTVNLLGWARGHDSAASMVINWVTWVGLCLAIALLALGLARARHDVHDGAQGAEDLRLGGRAAMVWSFLTLALAWPVAVGSVSWVGDKLGLTQSYGMVFAEALREQYVGLRPEFLVGPNTLVASEVWLSAGVATLLPVGVYMWAKRSGPQPRAAWFDGLLDAAYRVERHVCTLPAVSTGLAAALLSALRTGLVETLPAVVQSMARLVSGDVAAAGRASPRLAALGRAPWVALLTAAVIFGWLYLKPGIVSFGPTQFHNFGGLRPGLQRPLDPSRERAKARAAAQGSPATPTTTPRADTRDGALERREVPK